MKGVFGMFVHATWPDSLNVISLPGLADGLTLFDLLDGRTIEKCGPDHAHANLSPSQAKERGLLTSGICGRLFIGLLNRVDLQFALANRLQ
jgi:hypothetical protein